MSTSSTGAQRRARTLPASSRKQLPECGRVHDGVRCTERGPHFCRPRADHFAAFCEEVLVHTKGVWARRAFVLEDWQRDITDPIFGEVVWSDMWGMYVRRYSVAWIEIGRKNGKSELAAAIVLYLLVADGEESAEVYGAAKTTRQAGKVGEVVRRMMQLSPILAERLEENRRDRRISDPKTASVYEVIPADAEGELGHNPSGIVIDEFLAQATRHLYDALRTAMGARAQPLMVLITTAGNDPSSFPAEMHAEMLRVLEDPSRSPHTFVFIAGVHRDADPWDETHWALANPALGSFLSIDALRAEANDARNDPQKENAFRQFRLNQWVSQVTRWLPLHVWDESAGPRLLHQVEDDLAGAPCWAGLDLASTTDLAAWVLVFPDDFGGLDVIFRAFTPEGQLEALDKHTAGKASRWAAEGLLTATEGDWIDYDVIHAQIDSDRQRYTIVRVGYDQREATATAQHMMRTGLDVEPVPQGYWLSQALKDIESRLGRHELRHAGHPVARWNADGAEVRRNDADLVKLVKPARRKDAKRVDIIAALSMGIHVGIADEWTRPAPMPAATLYGA